MKFSVVMPIHNEEKNLPFSLRSIFYLEPDEIVLIFDRCKDKSLEVSKKMIRSNYVSKTKFIEIDEPSDDWNFRLAYIRRCGYKNTKNEIILNTDADTILDKQIKLHIKRFKKNNNVKLISFHRKSYPLDLQYFIRRFISFFSPKMGFEGLYVFSKSAWLETEDENSVKKIFKGEDEHIRMSIQKKYKRKHIMTNSIHLRHREETINNYWRGVSYWQVVNKPLWKAVIYSLIYLRPMMLVGYLHAKSHKILYKKV